jgi:TonB family protein
MGIASGWDPRFTRMIGVSACAHVLLLVGVLVVLPLVKPSTPPITGYTVELTDPSALGGKPPPGRPVEPLGPRPGAEAADAQARLGQPAAKPEPETLPPPVEAKPPEPPKAVEPPKPPEPVKPPEPAKEAKAVEPAVKLPSLEKPPPKPEVKKPEPKPEPPKVQTPAKPDAAKAAQAPPKPPPPQPAAKPADAKASEAPPAGKPTGKPQGTAAEAPDSYTAAAQKWRARGATGGGGGLGGTEPSNGPAGLGGYGGGGQVVGAEFVAYVQRISEQIRAAWVSPVIRSGLVAKVRCAILPNGEIASVELAETSGDSAFDASVVRAVRRAAPLPPPPARYLSEFREGVVVNFSSDDLTRGAG